MIFVLPRFGLRGERDGSVPERARQNGPDSSGQNDAGSGQDHESLRATEAGHQITLSQATPRGRDFQVKNITQFLC